MTVLIRNVQVIDSRSNYHQQVVSILIQQGVITAISPDIEASAVDQVINAGGAMISPGWVDTFAHFNDPGTEHKETLASGANAAAQGGFTHVFLAPNTQPTIQGKTQVEYITKGNHQQVSCLLPLAAITKNTEGKELAEMYDAIEAGAVAVTDGLHPIQTSGILVKALQYVKANGKVVMQIPEDKSIAPQGLMHEGIISTRLGLPGKPAIAEELQVSRDIELAKYTGSRLHFTAISSAHSLALIKSAKEQGLAVTCSVTPYHLWFTEEDLMDYDSNLKLNPPLRSKMDREALIDGVRGGYIDAFSSCHLPQDFDAKVCEFEYAKPGMETLEAAGAVYLTIANEQGINVETIVDTLSIKPRNIFDLPNALIEVGQKADLTLFDPAHEWVFSSAHIKSKCSNNAFIGKTLKGKVIATIRAEHLYLTT